FQPELPLVPLPSEADRAQHALGRRFAFRDVILDPEPYEVERGLGGAVAGDHDDHEAGSDHLELRGCFEPLRIGKAEIDEGDVDVRAVTEQRFGGAQVRHRVHRDLGVQHAESAGEPGRDDVVVFDYEDLHRLTVLGGCERAAGSRSEPNTLQILCQRPGGEPCFWYGNCIALCRDVQAPAVARQTRWTPEGSSTWNVSIGGRAKR